MKYFTNENLLNKYSYLIFDLDGTVYDETQYLFPAYNQISTYLAAKYKLREAELYSFLKNNFVEHGRTGLFNRLFKSFSIPDQELTIMLEFLRSLRLPSKLDVYQCIIPLFEHAIKHQGHIAILTNGNKKQQMNKVSQINWGSFLSKLDVCYAEDVGAKPSPAGINYFQEKYKFERQFCTLIGDTDTDLRCSQNAAVSYIDIEVLRNL